MTIDSLHPFTEILLPRPIQILNLHAKEALKPRRMEALLNSRSTFKQLSFQFFLDQGWLFSYSSKGFCRPGQRF
jgi:hypothetical protein